MLGPRWEDVDLERATLHVCRSLQVVDGVARLKKTKTARSRSIRVDEIVAETLDRRRRLQEIHREVAGDAWNDRWGLVFTEEDGSYLDPMNVTAVFRWLVRKLDVPGHKTPRRPPPLRAQEHDLAERFFAHLYPDRHDAEADH